MERKHQPFEYDAKDGGENESTLPVAEVFTSLQGEGIWAGTPMVFIRLAGCNVGKYQDVVGDHELLAPRPEELKLLRSKQHSICTSAIGQRFLCDTNYHLTKKWKISELVDYVKTSGLLHVCITGGEPFMHDLGELFDELWQSRYESTTIHVETSGTKVPGETYGDWTTCSPKKGFCLDPGVVDEWKFLISPNLGWEKEVSFVHQWLAEHKVDPRETPVFIGAVNSVEESNLGFLSTLARVILPFHYRLNLQIHKLLEMR